MGELFPNPLSTDSADRLNHKWMVLLMLVLSLAAFIIPLHPSYHHREQNYAHQGKQSSSPLGVKCWCPSRYNFAQMEFVNNKCQNSLLSAIEGKNDSGAYILPAHAPYARSYEVWNYSVSRLYGEFLSRRHENEEVVEKDKKMVRSLVTYQTPLMLLLVALALTVPQAVWTFLSECCCPINLALTLACAAQLSGNSRGDDFNLLKKSILNTQSKSTATVYLVKKVLAVVVVITLLLVVTQQYPTELQKERKGSDDIIPSSTTAEDDKAFHMHAMSESRSQSLLDFFKPPNDMFQCDFYLRRLNNLDRNTLECTVTVNKMKVQFFRNVQFESTLLHVVTSLLAVLAVANVFSLCGWMYRLVSVSSRNAVSLSGRAAMDTVLLVHMARINCGPHVAQRFILEDQGYSIKDDLTDIKE